MMAFRDIKQLKHETLINYDQRSILSFCKDSVCSSTYECDMRIPRTGSVCSSTYECDMRIPRTK